ncbi:MAG TPA: hypothetical protein IAC47_00910 [Candidatus Onthomorpha intestinigallinarum]|uniref:Uncharacterized protein n=1 Tax=Candidatus Onthomorpha intestinigallinarum TaxID=2840880 RepID=A0A9D1RFB4_9BACT|nr:hypothetical protein [Candidatus Onthomorpha intestinigallinarum]
MDILKELYEGLITEDEAYDKIDQVREDIHKGLYREFSHVNEEGVRVWDLSAIIGMDRYEYTAHCHAVPLSVIADWRYNGWPTKYFDTGEPVNYKDGYWFARKIKGGKYGLMSLRENKDKLRKKKNKLHKKKDKRHKKKDKLHKKKDKQRKKKK